MNTNTRLAKNPLCTARTRRVLLTGIASLLAGAGLHTHAAEAVFSSISLGGGDQDANVGLSATETYHSAANFSGGALTINGVAFEAGAGGDPINGANWSLTGAGGVFGGFSSGVDGQIGTMLSDFSYGGNPATFTLNNLTVGQTYVLTSYNGQFGGAGGRVTTVTGSSGPSTVYDENISSGLNLLRYTFTAAATSEALTFSPHSAGDTWHFYGFSNEQVFNNTWTSGADWTTAGWSVAAPNGVGTNADFTAQGTPTALNLDAARTVGHVRFDGANAWTLSTNNASTLTLQADAGGVSVLSATSGAHTISAPVQLNSAVMKFGAGSVRLTGAIAGSGKGITVSTGALVFETATADLTSVGSIANNGALSFINAGAQSYGGFITGTGGLTKSGAGTLTLGAAETYGGSTVISGGTLKLGPTVHVTFSNPGFETFDPLASGSYGYSPTGASWTFGGNAGISLNGGPFFDPTNHEGSAGGFIQGSGGGISQTVTVTQAGSYTFNFQGVSRAGGGPNGIVFQVDGTAVRTIDPGELSQATWQNYSASITLAAGSHTIAFVGNNVLGGDRSSVVDAVAGTTGGVLPSGTALSLTTTGAALDLSGNDQTLGSLAGVAGTNVQNIGAFTAGGDGTSTAFAGVISGAGSFTKAGNGVLTLSAANSYGGSTTISGGTLRTTGGSLPANTALSLTSATSVFDMNGVSHTLGSLSGAAGSSVLLGGGTLAAGNNNASTTFAGNITGAGSITKEGNGTLILSGGTGHNYSGNTTVSGGTLVSDTQNAGTTGLATIAGGATWDLGTASHTVIGLTGGGNITRNGLLSTGADGAALISPANNYLLKLDFGGGGNGGATVNGVTFDDIPTTSGGNWSLSGAGVQFGEGNISGLHSGYEQLVDDFYYNGSPGVLTLSGLTPGQTYNAVLYTKVGLWPSRPQNATFATGTASAQLLGTDPGTVGYYAYKFIADTTSMSVTMAPTQVNATFHWFAASLESLSTTTATLTIGDAGNYSFSGAINGGTKLIKQGAGTQELSGASNYSGGTNITAGAILSHNATGVGTGPVSVASGANYLAWWNTGSPLITNSFTLNGPGGNAGDGLKDAIYADGGGAGFAEYTITGNVTLNATSNIGGNNLNNLRVTGQITGPGGLTKGSGRADENNTLILANPANDYAGDTFITRGTVRLAA